MTGSARRRVAVTGLGVLSPAGAGLAPLWHACLQGEPRLDYIRTFDTSTFRSRLGGVVRDDDFLELVLPKMRRNLPRVSQLAVAAARLALIDARLGEHTYAPERTAVVVGTALAGWHDASLQVEVLNERGAARVNPFFAVGAPYHGAGTEVAGIVQARGPQLTFGHGCPAGLTAIAQGAALIAGGEADLCLVGGSEAPLTPLVYAGMGRLHELSPSNDDPARASRPFDVGRDGMVLAEGATLLVLEAEEMALARGAHVRAEILGAGSSCDAKGLMHSDETGSVAATALRQALLRSDLRPDELDYVCSHANASAKFDAKETAVLRQVLAEAVDDVPVSSIKGVIGHAFAASGPTQAAVAIAALTEGRVPPTANLRQAAPECALRHVVGAPLERRLRHVLVSSYGYGGVNGYLILGTAEGLRRG